MRGKDLRVGLASSLKPYVRRCLAATSIPPLSWAYRAFYGVLIRRATRRFASFPGTRAVYLTRGLTGDEFVAGISDIDFTLIGEWDDQERQRLMEWYARLARWIPLYDPNLSAYTPEELRGLYRISYYCQFRFAEGNGAWKLLTGADYVRQLEPLPREQLFGGLHTEMKAWWCRFSCRVYRPGQGMEDWVFLNSLCYKAVAEVLRLDMAFQNRRPLLARRQALECARQSADGETAVYLDRLLRCASHRCVHFDGSLLEDTHKFLLGHFEESLRRISSHPFLAPAEGVTLDVDSPAQERFRTQPEEALVSEMVEHARRRWAGSYRGAYLTSGLSFAMDEILLFLEVEAGRLPSFAEVRALGRILEEASRGLRRRVNVFLLLGEAAYQVCGCELMKGWQVLLTPWANPDVFLALARPQACLDGCRPRPIPRVGWTRPVADFIAEELGLFREALDSPLVYRANTLDFLRMFWKYLQLNAVAASAAAGDAVFPQTLPAVRRALVRHSLPQAPFLDRFEQAYCGALEGAPQEVGRLLPAAVSFLKQMPHDR